MIKKSYDISGKIDRYRLEVIESIKGVSDELNIPFFIIGATARDIILEYVYRRQEARATNDVDFGVSVNDWNTYKSMIKLLTEGHNFLRDKKVEHRILFDGTYPVDIVPFGKIASESGTFKWPKEQNEFTVIGFDEAYESSDLVKIKSNPDVIVNFAAPFSLVVLKIVSWDERYPERSRDASDIALIIESYLEAGNLERLDEEAADLIDDEFDFTIAGARLLGRDIAGIFSTKTLRYLLNILEIETDIKNSNRLIRDMIKTHSLKEESRFEHYLKLLESLKTGINERANK